MIFSVSLQSCASFRPAARKCMFVTDFCNPEAFNSAYTNTNVRELLLYTFSHFSRQEHFLTENLSRICF